MQTKNLINLKNIVVAIITLVVVYLMVLTASRGTAYHGGEHGKVIEDISKVQMPTQQDNQQQQQVQQVQAQQTQVQEERDELKELKDKAGSIGQIKVSLEYKSKCSACHGIDGSGMQDGRKLMGPKIYGQDADKIYKDLIDFKAGTKENVIMKGLLINTSEEELRKFADEIGSFSSQEKN